MTPDQQAEIDVFLRDHVDITESTYRVDRPNGDNQWPPFEMKPCWFWKLKHQSGPGTRVRTWDEVVRDSLHAALMLAATYAHDAERCPDDWAEDMRRYHRLLRLTWYFPVTLAQALDYETLRTPPKHTTPRIPIPRKAPKQALAWGMDPLLVVEARGRHAAYEYIDQNMKSPKALLTDWQHRALGQTPSVYEIDAWVERACTVLRNHGLGRLLGDSEGMEDLFEAP